MIKYRKRRLRELSWNPSLKETLSIFCFDFIVSDFLFFNSLSFQQLLTVFVSFRAITVLESQERIVAWFKTFKHILEKIQWNFTLKTDKIKLLCHQKENILCCCQKASYENLFIFTVYYFFIYILLYINYLHKNSSEVCALNQQVFIYRRSLTKWLLSAGISMKSWIRRYNTIKMINKAEACRSAENIRHGPFWHWGLIPIPAAHTPSLHRVYWLSSSRLPVCTAV